LKGNDIVEEEMKQYVITLKTENENLRQQIEVITDDRDQSKLGLQHILSKYIELLAEKEGKVKEEILSEIGEDFKNILKSS
jgi:hypothetical protein